MIDPNEGDQRADRAEAAIERFDQEVGARAIVLIAKMAVRDIERARRGLHRRMYVSAAEMVDLIDAVEEQYPGLIASHRDVLAALDTPKEDQ